MCISNVKSPYLTFVKIQDRRPTGKRLPASDVGFGSGHAGVNVSGVGLDVGVALVTATAPAAGGTAGKSPQTIVLKCLFDFFVRFWSCSIDKLILSQYKPTSLVNITQPSSWGGGGGGVESSP
jgi:hypothetical protein